MTATTQKVRLKYRCDQDFDNMSIGANGKPFCEMCQKSLVDFRTKSLTEVASYTQEKSGCGVFKAEHVESDEIMILSFASVRKYFLAIGTFFMAEKGYSQVVNDSIIQTLNVDSVGLTIEKSNSRRGEKKIAKEFDKEVEKQKCQNKNNNLYRTKYGVFFLRRFPFLSFKQRTMKYDLTGWY